MLSLFKKLVSTPRQPDVPTEAEGLVPSAVAIQGARRSTNVADSQEERAHFGGSSNPRTRPPPAFSGTYLIPPRGPQLITASAVTAFGSQQIAINFHCEISNSDKSC